MVTLSREEKRKRHPSCPEGPGEADGDINKRGRGRKLPLCPAIGRVTAEGPP